jgi:phosphohistidine phosphatase
LKTLLLIRHAKSDWNDAALKDFDRPLNDRGKKAAPVMGKRLLDKNIKIDAFISSPAKRAKKTAELIAKEYDVKKEKIIFQDKLYLAEPAVFWDVISKTDDDHKHIAVFSHNPGITDFANQLTPEDIRVDNIPTCGVFAVKANIKYWKDFQDAKKEFWFFDYPKAGED